MIKKFKASTMQEAMKMAKDYFGDDAVVLHSRKVKEPGLSQSGDDELVEITVSAEERAKPQKPEAKTRKFYSPVDARSKKAETSIEQTNSRSSNDIEIVLSELKYLQGSVDHLREDIRRSHMNLLPETYKFLAQDKGVETEFAKELVQNIFLKLEGADINDQRKIREALQSEISRSININNRMDLFASKAKLICLVGPTGMGKTTSIIKLATHPEFYGRKKVGLITIDTYRVAAAAQLKTFAALAKIPLEIVYEPTDFRQAVEKFRDMDVVLIDTAGRSPLNEQHLGDLRQFFKIVRPDEIHLVLSISSRTDNLVDAAENFAPIPVNNIIISKIDETMRLGNIYNISKKITFPISFLTNGQKVPDDIEVADKSKIANLIVN